MEFKFLVGLRFLVLQVLVVVAAMVISEVMGVVVAGKWNNFLDFFDSFVRLGLSFSRLDDVLYSVVGVSSVSISCISGVVGISSISSVSISSVYTVSVPVSVVSFGISFGVGLTFLTFLGRFLGSSGGSECGEWGSVSSVCVGISISSVGVGGVSSGVVQSAVWVVKGVAQNLLYGLSRLLNYGFLGLLHGRGDDGFVDRVEAVVVAAEAVVVATVEAIIVSAIQKVGVGLRLSFGFRESRSNKQQYEKLHGE